MNRISLFVLAVGLTLFTGFNVLSQNASTVIVPDVVGMTVPQASATLHKAGLRLGTQTVIYEEAGQSDTVRSQTLAAGTSINAGATLDVEVGVVFNVLLIYDENDITVVNLTGGNLNFGGMELSSGGEGEIPQTAFTLREIPNFGGQLEHTQCVQIWSDAADSSKPMSACERGVRNWFSTILPERHFWTGDNGANRFIVSYRNTVVGTCPTFRGRNERTCPLRLRLDAADTDTAEYLYFIYTTDELAILNPSVSRWMPLENVQVEDHSLDDLAQLPRIAALGDDTRLAPGECLLFDAPADEATSSDSESATPPASVDHLNEDCFSVGQATFTVGKFWGGTFSVRGTSERTCPPALPRQRVICMIPR